MFKLLIKWLIEKLDILSNKNDSGTISVSSNSHYIGTSLKSSHPMPSSINDYNRGMNFTVFQATGGKIVQLSNYDARTDRTISSLYIVTDNEDLGEELNLIITKESLTR